MLCIATNIRLLTVADGSMEWLITLIVMWLRYVLYADM